MFPGLTLRASMTRSRASSSPSMMLSRVSSSGLLKLSMLNSYFCNKNNGSKMILIHLTHPLSVFKLFFNRYNIVTGISLSWIELIHWLIIICLKQIRYNDNIYQQQWSMLLCCIECQICAVASTR